jgi:hypothetical protein
MEDDKIKYSDLISPDDSIKTLIELLAELNKSYSATLETVKAGAKEVVNQLKSMSTATSEGRANIDDATAAANRLARAQKELKFALSDTGKEVAWLKSQAASQNKMSVEQQQRAQALAGSYDKLKIQVKDLTRRYKELSAEDRAGDKGGRLLDQLLYKKAQLAELDEQMKLHVQQLSAVEKAEQKLAFLRSEEGKRLMQLKQQIADEIAANKTQKASVDEVAQAMERLRAAQSATRTQAHELNIQAKEANRVAKLTAQLNLSEAGSYNRLAAQYELNKIKLNAMSAAEREGTQAGKELEAETLALYEKMQKLQEATGNHRLSVGHYAKSWDGLGISVSQVVRELPAAAVSMNTFFLGISNNIPILIDEINKLRAANKAAVAEGKPTKSIIKSIAGALLSWNTLLVVGLTVLSMHGKAIIDWVEKLVTGRKAALSYAEALDNINEELETTNESYGKNITTLKKLSREWKNLSTRKEQLQWIKDNKEKFDQLDVSVRNVNEAENIFVDNTEAMIEALQYRAKAAAAMKLAADNYEKALIAQSKAEAELAREGTTFGQKVLGTLFLDPKWMPGSAAGSQGKSTSEIIKAGQVQAQKRASKEAESIADQYMKMYDDFMKKAEDILKGAGIDRAHKKGAKNRERHPRLRDLTDIIWRNDLSIRKKYEISLSELQRNEFQKRRIEAIDQTNQTIREMQEKFRKNEVYLTNPEGKFKPLTEQQKAQIERQQNEIKAIIENVQRKLQIDLTNLEYEYEIDRNTKLRQVMKWRLKDITDNIEEEKKLRLKQLEDQEALYTTKGVTDEGGEIVVTDSMTPEELAAYQRKKQEITAEYDSIILNMKLKNEEAQLEIVRKGTEEELHLLVHRNEIERQLYLAQNRLKPVEQREDETLINKQFDKRRDLTQGDFKLNKFDQQQALEEAEFTAVKRSQRKITVFKLKAEKERWKYMIELAKQGALDWSKEQIEAASYTVEEIERKIKEAEDFFKLVGEEGFGGALLIKLGFDDDQIEAFEEAANIIIENIQAIADAEVEAAEIAVEAAQKRVDAAQAAYDAEIEGRNNGYANNVATAKKELQQEKKNQAQKQKLLEEAQRRQEAINTAVQASSLITASANLWSSFSGMGPLGPALAIAAIAAMWTSFAVAKVKAAQVTKAASQEYGEGGLEFLEGGSHASGNDIDLQTRNSKGKNMRAEGGEAMAIINKRNTKKYRKMLPTIVDSLNKGTFEEKFSQAFKTGDELSQNVTYQQQIVDLSQLEEDVRALKRNSEKQYYVMSNGSYIEKSRNVTRIIH